jgi:acyl-CoA thioester hydrolase
VHLRDIDGVGHVNNAILVSYLEDARNTYLLAIRGKHSLADIDFVLAHTEIDYRSPALFGERLVVMLRPSRLGTKSYDIEYVIREASTGRLVAEAMTVQVSHDYARRESVPIAPDLRALLERDLERTRRREK